MGAYVANRVTDKLTRVTDHIYCCRSGSAADTQAIADIVAYHLSIHQMEIGEEPLVMTAAKIFQDLCYNYRDQMSAGIICAGWDRKHGGQVYCIPIGGMCIRQPFTVGGSGSIYIYGYLDQAFKENMSHAECVELTKKSVALAMDRDGSSGGCVRLATITESGVERDLVLHDDLPPFKHY
jgi:20S proteasome subunit beta 1